MNSKYAEGREATAEGSVDYDGDTLRLYLCSAAYLAIAWDDTADEGEEFIGEAHSFADVIGILDSVDLTGVDVTDSTGDGGAGWVTSDPAVFTGLIVGETSMCAVLRDVTADVLVAFYDHLAGDMPWEIVGTGANKTVTQPTYGWLRI